MTTGDDEMPPIEDDPSPSTPETAPAEGDDGTPAPDAFGPGHGALPATTTERAVVALVIAGAFIAAVLVLYVGATVAVLPVVERFPRLALTISQLVGLLVPSLVFLAVLRSAGVRTAPPPPARAPLRRNVGAVVGVAVTGLVVAQSLHVVVLSWLAARGWAWVQHAWDLTEEAYAPLLRFDGTLDIVTTVLVIALVPAICEEVTFRRCLQGVLATAWPAAVAIGLTAAIFSAFHLDPLGLVARVFLGVSIGIVYHRTQSLLAAGLVHAIHNALAVLLLLAAPADSVVNELPRLQPTESLIVLGVALAGGLAWGACIRALRRRDRDVLS